MQRKAAFYFRRAALLRWRTFGQDDVAHCMLVQIADIYGLEGMVDFLNVRQNNIPPAFIQQEGGEGGGSWWWCHSNAPPTLKQRASSTVHPISVSSLGGSVAIMLHPTLLMLTCAVCNNYDDIMQGNDGGVPLKPGTAEGWPMLQAVLVREVMDTAINLEDTQRKARIVSMFANRVTDPRASQLLPVLLTELERASPAVIVPQGLRGV